jgi:hypothetical protein
MHTLVADLDAWLVREGYSSVNDIVGLANQHVMNLKQETE